MVRGFRFHAIRCMASKKMPDLYMGINQQIRGLTSNAKLFVFDATGVRFAN
jgi:hypothetical protein